MYKIVVGGTFDTIHKGHEALLNKSIELAQFYNARLIITLTSDKMSATKKHPVRPYKDRMDDVILYTKRYINKDDTLNYTKVAISIYELNVSYSDELWMEFCLGDDITLVVSEETYQGALTLNKQLIDANLKPVSIMVVPLVMAKDGERISSSRIRNNEIDASGGISRAAMSKLSIKKQIAHIKEHQKEFDDFMMGFGNVDDYFHDYHDEQLQEGNHLYWCICADLRIKPLVGIPE